MAFVHDQSCECTLSQLDLFTVPPTQTSVVSGMWTEFFPVSSITSDTAPLEFNINGGDEYLDMSSTILQVQAKITRANGNDLEAQDQVGPINLFLHSLFSQVDISINGRLVSHSSSTYTYRALFESLLNYDKNSTETQLTTGLFYKDTPTKMDVANPLATNATANLGLKKRTRFTTNSKVIDLSGPLHADICFQGKYLLNGLDLKIKLHRAKDSFCLMSDEVAADYKVKIVGASLLIRKVTLSPPIILAHAKALEKSTAKYPIKRVLVKSFTVPQGDLSVTKEGLFTGQLPTRLVVGLVNNTAFNGSYETNPYNFQHFDLNKFGVFIDGQQVPLRPFTPKFTGDGGQRYILNYQTLFSGLNKLYKNFGGCLDREDYASGYALLCLDLTSDYSGGGHFQLRKNGNLRMELGFGTPLPATVNVVVYAEFESVVEIDRSRTVYIDQGN
ncbi:uncharacterized protein F54H12.2-like [Amphiura filiformis]|uniref:uncharacterized protein F54H12.2-like n=1 Tax=Amphiura filiformis TaxID=82378 RepID=UPI003B21283D